jgi:translation elongation factor P/translation initiation factor 5A
MNTKHFKFAALVLLPAAMFTISSCSSTSGESTTKVHKTGTGTTVVETFKAAGTVTAIDASTRKIKLTMSDGGRTTVKCGPEVRNFSQIHIHDRVNVTVTEQIAAYLDKGRPTGSSGATTIALAPLGAKPGVVVADTVRTTVKIIAIDARTRKVTFENKEGKSATIKVGEHIDLAKVKVGDSVTFRVTEAVAVSVEKP